MASMLQGQRTRRRGDKFALVFRFSQMGFEKDLRPMAINGPNNSGASRRTMK
jgi:hypothetical protein